MTGAWTIVGVLLLLAVNCNARSLSPVDVPDPPKTGGTGEGHPRRPLAQALVGRIKNPATTPVANEMSTPKAVAPTTTADPLDEYCKEACPEGLAGPECDCSDHPIGRRDVPSLLSSSQKTSLSTKDDSGRKFHKHPEDVVSVIRPGIVGQNKVTENVPSTTKDPLTDFCEVACKEGQGGVACDCPDHIIGRRSIEIQVEVSATGLVPQHYSYKTSSRDHVGPLAPLPLRKV